MTLAELIVGRKVVSVKPVSGDWTRIEFEGPVSIDIREPFALGYRVDLVAPDTEPCVDPQ